ncbi:MAG: protoporphyrinogen oxidase [Gemmatimonadetes bacterium]|nr:MAG: protoporphyrinogen oxidase [Gemmatimonadota bacterium]
MRQILIVYGTTDGQTRKIANVLAEDLRARRCSVDLVDAAGPLHRLSPETYDAVIVGASVHIGAFQKPVVRWVRENAKALKKIQTAFLPVCLAILETRPEARQEIDKIVERFFRQSGWRPSVTKPLAGALRYTQYSWLKKWMMKRIVAKAGGDTDTTRDHEYTDWNELRVFAGEFVARLATREIMTGAEVMAGGVV